MPDVEVLTGYRLRCASCGAAYSGTTQGEILTCSFCGTSQRMVDARNFLDHFLAQVTAFVRQAVPAGLDVSRSDTVDPVARLSAFNSTVRPRLSTESDQVRFSCFNHLATPLAVFPFSPSGQPAVRSDPTAVSLFAAKVQSVSGLAVDDSSRDLLRQAGGLAVCYQSLLVANRLSGTSQPERFHLIAQNFRTASQAIESAGRWPSVAVRLKALADQAEAIDLLLTGRELGRSGELLSSSAGGLNQARSGLGAMPEIGYMITAVDQELAVVRASGSMLRIAESSPMGPPPPIVYIQRLSVLLDWLTQNAPEDWGASFRTLKLREEVFQRAAEIRAAQAGRGTVRLLAAGSGCLVPFWVVELPYTFETGALWAKRGREVPELVLVAATFPADPLNLQRGGSARALTDVFGAARGGGQVAHAVDRWSGAQSRISDSGALAAAIQGSVQCAVTGSQAVPPLTTEAEALKLVQRYVEDVRASHPSASTQLRASSPRVIDLVYLPANLDTSPPIPWLGAISPSSLGNPETLRGFVT